MKIWAFKLIWGNDDTHYVSEGKLEEYIKQNFKGQIISISYLRLIEVN